MSQPAPWPSARTRRWVAKAVLPGSRIIAIRRLSGESGMSVHAMSVQTPDRTIVRVVLRGWTRLGWQAEDPSYTAAREAAVLERLEASPLAVPRLVAIDPDGSAVGVPALLMTRLPGRPPTLALERRPAAVRQLAETLVEIHALDLGLDAVVQPYAPYYDLDDLVPPRASAVPDLWAAAFDLVRRAASGGRRVFIHRDYHPWNSLWQRQRLTGIVDWLAASWGEPAADLAHLRLNLAADHDPQVAALARDAYIAAGGRVEHTRAWDVRAILDWLPDLGVEHREGPGLARLERYLAHVLADG